MIGLALYAWVAASDPAQRAAVRTFAAVSVGGLVTVLIGALVGGTGQYIFWGLTILLDVVAAAIGGRSEGWNLHPEHFAERHGLFVIIALGETLIVAAGGVTGADLTGDLIAAAVLAVAITGGLWWTYFVRAKSMLEHAMEGAQGAQQSMLARDVYSLIHFPMLCGVVAYAVAVEAAIAHPAEPLRMEAQIALAVGILLFIGGMAVAIWRAAGRLPLPRLVIAAVTAVAIVLASGAAPAVSLTIALAGIIVVAVIEQRSGMAFNQHERARENSQES
jgi:low temperature requirement protein LtrA